MSSTSVETFVFAFGGAKSSSRAISSNLSASLWSFYSINFSCERLVPSRKLILIDPYTSRAKNIFFTGSVEESWKKERLDLMIVTERDVVFVTVCFQFYLITNICLML